MADTLKLELVTPQRRILEVETPWVTLPGASGELGILPDHVPLLTTIGTGILRWSQGGEERRAAVHYGYAQVVGNRVTVLGRNQDGSWVYVDPWNYVGECWVRTSLLKILSGNVMDVHEFYGILPFSELYKPPRAVSAERVGDEVTVIWSSVWMTEDDYRGYLIEAWLCVDGQTVFTPVAIDGTVIILHDEAGCQQPSTARIYTAEKHGYTEWRLIHWPPNPGPASTFTPEP